MREYRERDDDEVYSYRRPPISAWVAAVAVAFSFFVLGGFVKTYLQLESLRDESRKEIRELKLAVEALRTASPETTYARQPQKRIAILPPVSRSARTEAATVSPLPVRQYLAEIDEERPHVTYSVGRSTRRGGDGYGDVLPPQGTPPSQVIAVNSVQKRIMVEGGRNRGFESGARLELSRQGRWIGDLRVIDVFETMSSCEVLHSTVTPEPGDIVRTP